MMITLSCVFRCLNSISNINRWSLIDNTLVNMFYKLVNTVNYLLHPLKKYTNVTAIKTFW